MAVDVGAFECAALCVCSLLCAVCVCGSQHTRLPTVTGGEQGGEQGGGDSSTTFRNTLSHSGIFWL